jgi:ATP-dependent RNA helicase RhlE
MHSETSAAEEIRTLTFDDLPLSAFLKETIKAIGYTTPTPIQAEAIPLVVEGRDLIGLAQTGTGKTAAFVLPILQKLSGTKEKGAKALIRSNA